MLYATGTTGTMGSNTDSDPVVWLQMLFPEQ